MSEEEILHQRLRIEPPTAVLDLLREFWKEQLERGRRAHDGGGDGLEVARDLADGMDAVVKGAYTVATKENNVPAHALVALGGYGRREMGPYSDVDLLFLFKKEKDKSPEFISGVLHPLWDLGFDIGHSSRMLGEVIKSARQDIESCTAMMDSRFLAGDRALYDDFQERLFKRIPRGVVGKIQAWRQVRHEDRDSVQLLEPNVKESPGGLRDVHTLEWVFKARAAKPEIADLWKEHFDDEAEAELNRGRSFLWRVRHQLHFAMGRRHDVLQHDIKPDVARSFGYEDRGKELGVESFMRDYYLHARAVYHQVELAFARLTRKVRGGSHSILVERWVAASDGEISLLHPQNYFSEDPLRLLRIFYLAQTKKLHLGEAVQRVIRASLHLIDDEVRRSPEARDLFLRILKRKNRVAATLRVMHEAGVLGAYLPEFGELTCLVQYDLYHLYTVDEHTLVALEHLDALGKAGRKSTLKMTYDQLERRDLLYLGLMLHDVGKSKRQSHIPRGLEMAEQLLERLGLPEADRRQVLFLIERHHDLISIAQRRDLDDYKMIAEFAAIFPDIEALRQLYLLSYADMSAVAPDVWNDWQGALLWELYYKTSQQLESGIKALEDKQLARQALDKHLAAIAKKWPALRVVAFEEHVAQLPPRYTVAYDHEQIGTHLEVVQRLGDGLVEVAFLEHRDHTEVVICTRDQRQLLAKICGALAVNDLDILRADVHTRDDDVVLDLFQVTDVDGNPLLPDWKKERVCQRLEDVVALRQKARSLLEDYSANWDRRKRQKDGQVRPPLVEFENQVSDKYTVIDTNVQDDVGLLYAITHELAELDLDIHMAIINTVADRAVDAFYVVNDQGEKIVNFEVLEEIRERLETRLAG